MNYCVKCGSPLKDSVEFCSQCGERTKEHRPNYSVKVKKTQEYKSGMNLMVGLIIAGILLLGLGFSCYKIAEPLKGIEVGSGYFSNGKFVSTGEKYRMGGKPEKVKGLELTGNCCYLAGAIVIVLGILGCLKVKIMDAHPVVRQCGIVIGMQDSNTYVIEFEDGSRKCLVAEPSIWLGPNEAGLIGYKNNKIVEFTRR